MEESIYRRSKVGKERNSNIKLKLNSFKSQHDDDNELMPTTMLKTHKKQQKDEDGDDGFFSIENRPSKHLLTERQADPESYDNEFDMKPDADDHLF